MLILAIGGRSRAVEDAGLASATDSATCTAEMCNGQDDDCDGVIDGLSRPCYPDLVVGCDLATGRCAGICHLGVQACPQLSAPATSNSFAGCQGATIPGTELCNGLDDDCNGIIDDVLGGCAGTCVPRTEICNGEDDDCNGIADDDVDGDGAACAAGFDLQRAGVGVCRAGRLRCLGGALLCAGSVAPGPELCNGQDDDCDGVVDGHSGCPDGHLCAMGACAPACGADAGPCDGDRRCADLADGTSCAGAGCACLPCPPGGCGSLPPVDAPADSAGEDGAGDDAGPAGGQTGRGEGCGCRIGAREPVTPLPVLLHCLAALVRVSQRSRWL
jgi:hypothetical protein